MKPTRTNKKSTEKISLKSEKKTSKKKPTEKKAIKKTVGAKKAASKTSARTTVAKKTDAKKVTPAKRKIAASKKTAPARVKKSPGTSIPVAVAQKISYTPSTIESTSENSGLIENARQGMFQKIDVFAEVARNKKDAFLRKIATYLGAFAIAISVNSLMLTSPGGIELQASVLNALAPVQSESIVPDLVLKSQDSTPNVLELVAGRDMRAVKEIRLMTISDPSVLRVIRSFGFDSDTNIVYAPDESGITSIFVRFTTPRDVRAGESFAKIIYSKQVGVSTNVSLTETTFVAEGVSYQLSNAGIELK